MLTEFGIGFGSGSGDKMSQQVQPSVQPMQLQQHQQNIELLRCLYHLDLFRRSVRKLRAPAPAPAPAMNVNESAPGVANSPNLSPSPSPNPVYSIRELFNSLTILMSDYSENNINPVVINNMISKFLATSPSWSALKEDGIYERICQEMSGSCPTESSTSNNQQIQPLLRYNLTKVCTTCGSSTPMNGCVKDQYLISMEPIEALTLEEQITASLDSNEFCQESNCFGHQRTYRSLNKLPNIFTFDYRQTSTKLFSLHEFLIPSMIFDTQQDSIYKITAVTLSPASSLVYHSRLNLWLFINHNTIKPLCSNFNNLKFNFNPYNVQLVFYTVENLFEDVIYENWRTATPNTAATMISPPGPKNNIMHQHQHHPQNARIPSAIHTDLDTDTEYYDSGISSYNSSIETSTSSTSAPDNQGEIISISNGSGSSSGSGSGSGKGSGRTHGTSSSNYATIKRNRTKCKNIIKSISVPNLVTLPSNLTNVKRKVSFNCDIELLDMNEEYNPHPILLKILEKMKL